MVEASRIGIFAGETMELSLRRATDLPISVLNSLTELRRFVRADASSILFIDPMLIPSEYRWDTLRQVQKPRHINVVVFTHLSPGLAEVLKDCAKMGFSYAVRPDNDVTGLKARLDALLAQLRPYIDRL